MSGIEFLRSLRDGRQRTETSPVGRPLRLVFPPVAAGLLQQPLGSLRWRFGCFAHFGRKLDELELETRSLSVEHCDIVAGCLAMLASCNLRSLGISHNGQAAEWYYTGCFDQGLTSIDLMDGLGCEGPKCSDCC